jgi:predicted SAM-dependent methyltransferase
MSPPPVGVPSSEAAIVGGRRTVLNVGCGHPHRRQLHRYFHGPQWREIRLDVDPAVRPDIICSITNMSGVASACVDAVWSSHNLEHIHRHEVPTALGEFFRVLKPTGLLLLTLPDLQQVAELVAADKLEEQAYLSPSGPVTPLDMIYGHTPSLARGNMHMAHKTGFTRRSLQLLLAENGFVNVSVRRGGSFDLWAAAYKPAGR